MRFGGLWGGIWAVVGLAAGISIGWWIGAAAACGTTCRFDVALFEAIGTWIGGLGISAVAGFYVLYRTHRDRADELAQAEHEATASARECALRFVPKGDALNGFQRVHIEFENKLNERVYDVGIRIDGKYVKQDRQVAPGRAWGTSVVSSAIGGLNGSYPNEEAFHAALKGEKVSPVVFTFTIRHFVFERTGREVSVVKRPEKVPIRRQQGGKSSV
jgi:hypothetical protein